MVHTTAETLHRHYDLERPGYRGYDRRHYPEKHRLTLSESIYKPRGRAHIPSPPLEEVQWRPHGRHIAPAYSNIGPDWNSRLRYISSPRNPDAKPTLPAAFIEQNIHFMRPFPQNWQRSSSDYVYVHDESNDHRPAKRNFFANFHLRSVEDLGDENVHMQQIGQKKRVYSFRNGIGKRSDGDKSYQRVELSPDFYKFGSTLPLVNFGHNKKSYGSEKTIVPMKNEIIPIVDENHFQAKERQIENEQIIQEVIQLENWKPSESMTRAFQVFDTNSSSKISGKYRPRVR